MFAPPADAASVAAGGGHNCAIARSGSVLCWGANASGQLGNGSTTPSSTPVVVPAFVPETLDVTALTTGSAHSCALELAGTVSCWGENGAGQLGDGGTTDSSSPVAVAGVADVVKLAAGLDFTCALIADGSVDCWGEGSLGQLGDGTPGDSLSPVTVSGLLNASDISAGDAHVCVLASGSVRCWGDNTSGQLGDGTTTQADSPVTVSGVSGVTQVSAGAAFSCARTAINVKCWGANGSGQLGDGTTVTPRTTAVTVGGLTSPSRIATGGAHSCAVDATPAVKCWGANASGQLGDASTTPSTTPVAAGALTGADVLSASGNHTCALAVGGQFVCWGSGSGGVIGDGGTTDRSSPATVINTAGGKLIAGGSSHTCAALSGGKVNCWGVNGKGQLGDFSTSTAAMPVVAFDLFNLSAITTGTAHSCAVEVGGQAKCWGDNQYGQVGKGTTGSYDNLAVPVSGLTNATRIDAGANHNCAVTTAAQAKCWGQNGNYQLGDGSNTNRNAPITVTGLSNVTEISGGGTTTCVVVSGGQAKCWGANASGQVGQGNTTSPVTAPANVSGLTDAVSVTNGLSHSCAVVTGGTVKCWGDNTHGQLGDASNLQRTSPVTVSGLSGATSVVAGDYHSCAIVTLGAVKCWGYGANGRLGNAGTASSNVPVDVSGLLGTVSVSGGGQHTCAVIAAGQTYCWGYGLNSQLGNGSTSDRTTPYEAEKVLEGLVRISSPTEGSFVQSTQPSIDYSTIDAISPLTECNLDGAGFNTCSFPPFTPGSPLGIGRHTLRIKSAPSFFGNDVVSYTNISFAVSVVLPTATISSPVEGAVTNDNTPTVSFSGTGDGALSYACRVDSGGWSGCSSPWTTGTLADGAHALSVRVTDSNTNVATAIVNLTIDTTAPNTTITANPPALTNSSSATLDFESSEAGGSFQCRVDSGSWSACSDTVNLTGLPSGPHTFEVRAIDVAGNTDASPASYGWTIDTVAPNTTITANPATLTTSTAAAFSFNATETATFQCQLDGGGYGACTSPRNYSSLADGSHTFDVRATDTAGNTDATPASFTWTVDTVAPNTSIIANPVALSNSTSAAFSFSATETATFQCQLDGGGYGACTSPRNHSSLAEGSHTFDVRATDTAGNTDATPASFTWTVDTVAPNTSITANPPSVTNSTTASFSLTATETSTFQCQLDGGGYSACTSPRNYTSLADGSHTFMVRATDAAGNTDGTSASYTWTVDTTAPDTSITANPAALSNSASAAFSFSATETATFQCQLDGGGYGACASPRNYSSLAEGSHTFDVRATDAAGNVDATPASFTWTVDTVAPNTTITASPNAATMSTSAAFSFSATETATFQCQLDGGGYGACTSPRNYSSLAEGSHTFDVRATDTAGNTDATPASFTWSVDLTPPNTTITSTPSAPSASAAASFSFSATETATFQCQLDGGGYGACTSPRNYSSLAEGSHTFDVRATDTAGNTDGTSASFTWTVDTTAPNTSITANPAALTTSTAAAFNFSATETATFQCQLDGGGYGACTSPRNYSALADGPHTFDVRATDSAGNLDPTPASFSWTIDTTSPNTSITANPATPTNSTSAAFSFSATETSTFQCQLDGGGYSSCTSPRNYSSLAAGAHSFDVRATDTAGNTDATPASFSWTIDTTAPNTTIDGSPAAASISSGAAFTFSATETSTFQCQLDGGGYGSCTSPRNYASLADGSHTFDVRATDTAGNTDATPASFTWTIDTGIPNTTITASPPSASNSASAAFSFSATETATFQCQLDGSGYSACTSPRNYASLADGSHTFDVRATDTAGNTDGSPASFTWTIDTAAPNTSITANPAVLATSGSAAFSFSATETATFQCRLDGGGYGSCTSPRNYASLADGSHTFDVRATDTAGNTDATPASFTWTVDTVSPNTTITASPAALSQSDAASFSFSASETATYQCQLDGGGYSACPSPRVYSALADGSHTFMVRATDTAGNTDPTPAGYTWSIDATSPDVQITFPSEAVTLGDTTPSFSFTATDANGVTIECRVDAAAFAACSSPYTAPALIDGAHTMQVRAVDPAGNETFATRNFTIDSTFPTVAVTAPAEGAVTPDPTPAISFDATGSGGLTTECRVDGGGFAACASGDSLASLADGPHTVTVRVTDGLSRVATADRSFTVDSVAPAVNFSSPAGSATLAGPSVDVAFGVTDATAVAVTCKLDAGAAAPCASPFATGPLADGPHSVTIDLTDAAGNTGSGQIDFTIDQTDPVVTIGSPADGATVTTATATVSFASSDASAVTHECSVDGGAYLPCVSPYSPTLASGAHSVSVRGIDAAGNASTDGVSFTFSPPAPQPPPPGQPPADPPPAGPQTYTGKLIAKKKGAKLTLSLKLTPPAGVSAACAGTVSFSGKLVRAKVKGSAVLKTVSGACVAKKVVKVKKKLRGKLRLTAKFPGSAQIASFKQTKTIKVK